MKKVLFAVVALVVVVAVVLFIGLSNLGPLIKKAVNTQGPKITGTALSLGDVDIALLSGKAKLQNFLLGNPQGFSSPHAVAVKSIYVDVDEKSLTKETIVIDRIEVVGPDVYYEKGAGSDNFKALQKNIRRAAGSDSSKTTADRADSGKKLVIRDLVIRDGKVHLAVKGLAGQEVSAALPEIRLQNIGQDKAGVTPAEAAQQIFAALYGKVSSPDVNAILNKGLQGLQGNAEQFGQQAVQQAGEKAAEEATEKLKGLFNK
ncbi:MAG: AsmA family protein [Syntrophotaleaceae bacterium]